MRLGFISLFFILLLLTTGTASAQQNWDWATYTSGTSLYKIEFPAEPDAVFNRMRISNERVIEYEQMALEIPLPVEGNHNIRFYTRVFQTWGAGERYGQQGAFIFNYVKQFLFHYENLGGKIITDADIGQGSYHGRELLIYLPPEDGQRLAVHARIFFEERSIIHQIMIAPVEHIDNATALRFMYSLDLLSSDKTEPGDVTQSWSEIPLNKEKTISILLPQPAPPYMSEPPKFERSGNLLRVSALFYDPFQNEHLLFRAYLYDFTGQNVSKKGFRQFVAANHDVKSGRREWEHIAINDMVGLKYTARIGPSNVLKGQEYKNMKAWYAKNYYDRDYIIVLETSGSQETIFKSAFEDLLFGSLNFERDARLEAQATGRDITF